MLTFPGETLSSRVAAGLNEAIHLPIMNAESRKAYVEVAVKLRQREMFPLLEGIRTRIYDELGVSLFNSTKFSARLETAYKAAYEIFPSYKHLFFAS